ncbi:type II toxin-antitoxin system RelE/ParE family toxin [Flavivirga eckloniae]|uniref:Type II toxin-antitoxin system RelE/ParE family toxin n=1 Tax=Flavivirga eckloniae TaxID=1803846 RepID=A0A2K9PKU6_9FLAO|nr:type II toxin-antitoxin system RelE/ParE family toxin [Flavivirga eckloniae]AUP77684.1 hypothetical protein C1H87_02715 [Flavivirga eckloniae]
MRIVWTQTAELSFEAEIDFILKKWTNKEATSFINLVEEVLEQLKKFPLLGRLFENDNMYLVISKQTTLIYRVLNEKTLELLLLWNNKQNPENLEKAIKNLKVKSNLLLQ